MTLSAAQRAEKIYKTWTLKWGYAVCKEDLEELIAAELEAYAEEAHRGGKEIGRQFACAEHDIEIHRAIKEAKREAFLDSIKIVEKHSIEWEEGLRELRQRAEEVK